MCLFLGRKSKLTRTLLVGAEGLDDDGPDATVGFQAP